MIFSHSVTPMENTPRFCSSSARTMAIMVVTEGCFMGCLSVGSTWVVSKHNHYRNLTPISHMIHDPSTITGVSAGLPGTMHRLNRRHRTRLSDIVPIQFSPTASLAVGELDDEAIG